jgi:sialate O-acetylesterase
VAVAAGSVVSAFADVQLHGLFTDNMVLQRDAPLAVYGQGDDGEAVTVQCNGSTASTRVVNGRWQAMLPPMPAGGPYILSVAGKNTVTLQNVLLGDVWVCTGQSNMATQLRIYKGDGYKEYQHLFAGLPQRNAKIRLFRLKQEGADTPQYDVAAAEDFGPSWRLCDEESALKFSAMGYLFGHKLQPAIDVPVGLIHATVGGTMAESWVSLPTLQSRPEFKAILDDYEIARRNYPVASKKYEQALAQWKALPPADRQQTRLPAAPMGPGHMKRPAALYNLIIAPLQQFPINGVIWYQGEGNAGQPVQYRTLFPALITSWRQQWGQGDLPFLFVQLAAFKPFNPKPEDPSWAWLREAQAMALSLPHTGMAVAIDAGHQTNIHPPDKPLVADRLVATALKVAYGRAIVAAGPTFRHMRINGRQAVLEFDHTGGGLIAKAVEFDGGHRARANELKGFAACGEDRVFKWANAIIRGDTVVVTCPDGTTPAGVRYAWSDFPLCNLYNKEGFPAVPFRTDQYPPGQSGRE